MNNDLVERYIYAVTRRLPGKQRDDVSMELRTLIDDMLTERCGSMTPSEKDIRVVLTELGTPQELYAQYDADADKCLIGQPYYSTYKLVLKSVLPAVAVGMVIANLIIQIIEPQMWLDAISQILSFTVDGIVTTFAVVTALFAYLHYKGIHINERFNLDELPSVPKKKQEISRVDAVVGIGFDVVFLAIFLAAPQLLGLYRGETGQIIPIFNVAAIRASWLIIVLFGALGIFREIVKLTEGRYNRKVMITSVAADLLSAGLACWWLSGAQMFNPDFVENVLPMVAEDGIIIIRLFENFPQFFLGVMLFALALDMVNAIYRYFSK